MKAETKISWSDYTFNPWIGCVKVTDGCKNCYAETMDKRFSGGVHWGPNAERRTTSIKNWNQVLRLNRECKALGIRKVVFCASLADVFEDNPKVYEARVRLWALIEQCDSLDWLLLTKRPQNIIEFIPASWKDQWPSNVMPGVSICSEKDYIMFQNMNDMSDRLRFQYLISMEPLLGYIDLKKWMKEMHSISPAPIKPYSVIVGGESGPHARPLHPDWIRSIKKDCQQLGIVFHFKQWGEWAEYCKNLDEGGHKTVFIHDDEGKVVQSDSSNGLNPALLLDSHFAKMVRYGVKNTGNRLDGMHYMPKVFYQNTNK